jgi:hypothetical protein
VINRIRERFSKSLIDFLVGEVLPILHWRVASAMYPSLGRVIGFLDRQIVSAGKSCSQNEQERGLYL